jgi:two-component system chemotaxis response regulator CheB
MGKIKVLICDDSALMRTSLKKIVESAPDLFVVGAARDGVDAVTKARELRPDVITMDINMPGMDGITALQVIMAENIAPVLMVSSLTQEGAQVTFEALALGAFDCVPKPGGTVSAQMGSVAGEIIKKLKAAAKAGTLAKLSRGKSPAGDGGQAAPRALLKKKKNTASVHGFKAIAMGISTGGPKTLFEVLPFLPGDLNASVFLVQHMPPTFTCSFAQRIDAHCPMKCVEASVGMSVEPGTIYLGKGGTHLMVHKKADGAMILRTPNRPEHSFIPSVDIMMSSVLEIFGSDTVGVLMTGMGDDGADSMVKIRQAGGVTIAESEESAIVFGMPREAIERGGAQIVSPSWEMANQIIKAVK